MIQPFPTTEGTTRKRALADAPSRKLRVVVADDTPPMRTVLASILRDDGHDVREAPDGLELLAIAAWFEPDVIVTDFQMPRMSGLDVLHALRERGSRARVILMTASPVADVRGAAFSLGAVAVLSKPFDVVELMMLLPP